jgi:hypothetical protein
VVIVPNVFAQFFPRFFLASFFAGLLGKCEQGARGVSIAFCHAKFGHFGSKYEKRCALMAFVVFFFGGVSRDFFKGRKIDVSGWSSRRGVRED